MANHVVELPRKGKQKIKQVTLKFPTQFYDEMVKDGKLKESEEQGLVWGEVTPFIFEAIREKLERIRKGDE